MTFPLNVSALASDHTAPTGDHATRHPAHYRNGYNTAVINTLRREKDELRRTVEVLLAALQGGEQWEIDHATALAHRELHHLEDNT